MSERRSETVEPPAAFADETRILDELHGLVARPSGVEALPDELPELERHHGTAVYSELLFLLSHLRFKPDEAKPHWERILRHRESMRVRLEAPVDLRVALVSYFLDVYRRLENPKVIEMRLYERERASAFRDELTGLYNYRLFREHLTREVDRAARDSKPLSLVMIDIDNFKLLNDLRGHEVGNLALSRAASALAQSLGRTDIAARYGGEEFAMILPATSKTTAQEVAERARGAIAASATSQTGPVTASLGVATYPADADTDVELVRRADQALYVAKTDGKNRVALYGYSRRSYPRVDASLPGWFRVLEGRRQPLTTVNLSEGGILFRAARRVDVGALVETTVEVASAEVSTSVGRVVHVEKAPDGSTLVAVQIGDGPSPDRPLASQLRKS